MRLVLGRFIVLTKASKASSMGTTIDLDRIDNGGVSGDHFKNNVHLL